MKSKNSKNANYEKLTTRQARSLKALSAKVTEIAIALSEHEKLTTRQARSLIVLSATVTEISIALSKLLRGPYEIDADARTNILRILARISADSKLAQELLLADSIDTAEQRSVKYIESLFGLISQTDDDNIN